ncbi:MAG: repressor LexA [Sedimentisphaerales bacterium]|nr:repressor LexA [Sedimentisphaerales bacterium]
MEPLTKKQQQIFNLIKAGRSEDGRRPSQREIAKQAGMAQNSVYQIIGYLKKKGYLVNHGGHRGLGLSAEYLKSLPQKEGLPVIGTIAAGLPILAQENIQEYIDAGDMFEQTENSFILKVAGNSMIDEGIMDGDFVVVRNNSEVGNGKIGAVLINDEATIKKVYIQKNRIALEPANKAGGYKTIYVKKNSGDIRIIGPVTGCFRKL